MLWSWILMVIGVTGLWIAGRGYWWAWLIGLAAQALWVVYAFATEQYGFIVSAFVYGFVYARNARLWLIQQQNNGELNE